MKKEYKKILVNGLKIQEIGDSEKEYIKWTNQFSKVLKKYNINSDKYILIRYVNKNLYSVMYDNEILEMLSSKNMLMVYLNQNNNIEIVNDYNHKIEIIKNLEEEEKERISTLEENYQDYTKKQLVKLNILDGD